MAEGTKGVLFTVQNGHLILKREELRGTPSFRKIIERDRGGTEVGDSDGRRKIRAFKEFMYIFYMCDYESPFAPLDDETRHKKAVTFAKLPEGWKPDKDLRTAIADYIQAQDDALPTARIINSIKYNLNMADKIVKLVGNKIQKQLDSISAAEENGGIEIPVDVTSLVNDLQKIQTITDNLPKTFDTLDALEKRLSAERGGGTTVRGGGTKGNREDPDYISAKFQTKELDS